MSADQPLSQPNGGCDAAERVEARRRAQARLRGPAWALAITAIIGVLANTFRLLRGLFPEWLGNSGKTSPSELLWGGIFLVLNGIVLVGAWSLLQLRHRGLALLGSMAALFNFSLGVCVLAYPSGAWALWAMEQPDVKEAFQSRDVSHDRPSRQGWLLVLGFLSLVPILGLVAGPLTWELANDELKALARAPGSSKHRRLARSAKILGMVGTILWGMAAGAFLVYTMAQLLGPGLRN
ncbi:MAG: hypothetical protein NZ700_08585 [Gemmataceae bacterium]|nr:hypothetical protein [Gemmataceae bacterium]MDW8266343.1 hypothetical protein [Gemmataceae bacterium]